MHSSTTQAFPEGVDDSFQRIGKHYARVDEDLIWLFQIGVLELHEVVGFFQLGYSVGERYGYVLFLGNARHALPPTPEARRYQVEQIKRRNFPSHTAVYGANFVVRALVTLTQRATELVTGKPPPLSFVKDEEAARKCLSAARESFQLKLKTG